MWYRQLIVLICILAKNNKKHFSNNNIILSLENISIKILLKAIVPIRCIFYCIEFPGSFITPIIYYNRITHRIDNPVTTFPIIYVKRIPILMNHIYRSCDFQPLIIYSPFSSKRSKSMIFQEIHKLNILMFKRNLFF